MKTAIDILTIKRINSEHSEEIYQLLKEARKEYIKHFTPFKISSLYIHQQLQKSHLDLYFGFYLRQSMIGFYMLRGFDEGFDIPAYGVFISEKYKSLGLGKLSLSHAITLCRINNLKKLMLKVHPENKVARKLYERSGFYLVGTDPKNNNLILHKDL